MSNGVDNEVVRNIKFNTLKTKVNNPGKKIPDASTWIHINQYNKDTQNLKKKIGDVDKKAPDTKVVVTTTVLNTKISEVVYKIPNINSLVTATVLTIKNSEVENKIPDLPKYITTVKFNKFTKRNFTTRLKQAGLVTKTDFDNKLTCFNRKIVTSKK